MATPPPPQLWRPSLTQLRRQIARAAAAGHPPRIFSTAAGRPSRSKFAAAAAGRSRAAASPTLPEGTTPASPKPSREGSSAHPHQIIRRSRSESQSCKSRLQKKVDRMRVELVPNKHSGCRHEGSYGHRQGVYGCLVPHGRHPAARVSTMAAVGAMHLGVTKCAIALNKKKTEAKASLYGGEEAHSPLSAKAKLMFTVLKYMDSVLGYGTMYMKHVFWGYMEIHMDQFDHHMELVWRCLTG